MLWSAGQERIGREIRNRLTELYVGVRDGQIAALVAIGEARASGDHVPAYVRSETSSRGSVASQQATLSRLAARFPNNVKAN